MGKLTKGSRRASWLFKIRPEIHVSVTQVNEGQGRGRECQAEAVVCVKAGKERQAGETSSVWLELEQSQGKQ